MLPGAQPHEKKAGLAYWASRVLEECDKASEGFAADPVHDLRVAIRRCRSMADGFLSVDPDPAWKQMKRLGKPLFSSLGDLRDTQVMLEWVAKLAEPGDPVAESLNAELLRKETDLKTAAQTSLASFDRKHWISLNAHLARRTGRIPLDGLVFQHVALERWLDARELHRRAMRNRSSVAYHQLRIGIKRFRYTVENFLPVRHGKWSKDLRDLQDALGEVHDLDVLNAILKSHAEIQPAGRIRWQQRIAQERQQRVQVYREKMVGKQSLWNVWRADLPTGDELELAGVEKLRTWAAFLDPDIAHSRLVHRLSLQLFDGVTQCGILKIAAENRRLLEAAAWLHEIGRHADQRNHDGKHQRRGYRQVLKLTPPVGWTEEDMQCVAAMVRYHRGGLPETTASPFVGVSLKRRSDLLALTGILRLANAFDESHDHLLSDIEVELANESVVVSARGMQEFSPTAQYVAKARYMLEAVCKRPLMIRALPAETIARPPQTRMRRQRATAVQQ
jgi:CHAD domain-containing protein